MHKITDLGNQGGKAKKMKKKVTSQQSDINKTKQIRVDAGLHKLLKIKAATEKTSIKALTEDILAEVVKLGSRYGYKSD